MAIIQGGVRVAGFVSPVDSEDTYPVVDPIYGIGGFRVVGSISDMYAIPYSRRRVGMIVRVNDTILGATLEDYRLLSLGTEGQETDVDDWELLNLNYQLPVATNDTLGGVKGDGVTTEIEEDGTISVLPLQGELEQWKTAGTGSSDNGKYTKVFSVKIEQQYAFCSAHIMAISGGHTYDENQSEIINLSVKKQSEMPSSAISSSDAIVNITVTSTGNSDTNDYFYTEAVAGGLFGAPISIIVNVYLKMNRTYDTTKFILIQEHISENATFTTHSNQSFQSLILDTVIPVEYIYIKDIKSKATDAHNHSQVTTGNPHNVEYSQLAKRPLKDEGLASPNAYIGATKEMENSSTDSGLEDLGVIELDSYSGRYYQFNTGDDSDLKKYFYINPNTSLVLGSFAVIRLKANSGTAEPHVFLSSSDALNAFNSGTIANPLKKVIGHEYDDTIDMILVVQAVPEKNTNSGSVTAEYFFLRDDNLN